MPLVCTPARRWAARHGLGPSPRAARPPAPPSPHAVSPAGGGGRAAQGARRQGRALDRGAPWPGAIEPGCGCTREAPQGQRTAPASPAAQACGTLALHPTQIEGESLLNDGTALVIFAVLQLTVENAQDLCLANTTVIDGVTQACEGSSYAYQDHWYDAGACIWKFIYMAVIGGLFGLAMAVMLVAWISKVSRRAPRPISLGSPPDLVASVCPKPGREPTTPAALPPLRREKPTAGQRPTALAHCPLLATPPARTARRCSTTRWSRSRSPSPSPTSPSSSRSTGE